MFQKCKNKTMRFDDALGVVRQNFLCGTPINQIYWHVSRPLQTAMQHFSEYHFLLGPSRRYQLGGSGKVIGHHGE